MIKKHFPIFLLVLALVLVLGTWSSAVTPVSGGASGASFLNAVTAKSANFSADFGTDNATLFDVTTSTSTITVTLTSQSGNAGKYIVLRKADTGSGKIVTSPTLSPAAVSLMNQGQSLILTTDGTNAYALTAMIATMDANGAIALTGGAANQNITLTTSGTGQVSMIAGAGNNGPQLNLSNASSANNSESGINIGAGGGYGVSFRQMSGVASNSAGYPSGSFNISLNNSSEGVIIRDNTTERFRFQRNGLFLVNNTVTVSGTTGAQTINKPRGTVRFAAGASTLVVTDSLVASTSKLRAFPVGAFDATATDFTCTAASGSFTITANAAATAETEVAFDLFIP